MWVMLAQTGGTLSTAFDGKRIKLVAGVAYECSAAAGKALISQYPSVRATTDPQALIPEPESKPEEAQDAPEPAKTPRKGAKSRKGVKRTKVVVEPAQGAITVADLSAGGRVNKPK